MKKSVLENWKISGVLWKYINPIPGVFLAATFFGLVSGMGEGIILLVLQEFGKVRGVSADILWISPILNLVLFNLAAFFWILVGKVLQKVDTTGASLFTFIFLTALSWLGILLYNIFYEWAVLILCLGLAFQITRMINKSTNKFYFFIRRRIVFVFLCFLVLLIGIPTGRYFQEKINSSNLEPTISNLPNVILIVMDTVRADHLSTYGYDRPTTPFLDQVASQGVLFSNAIAPSSLSLPSHASIFSGRYVYEHGVEWNNPLGYQRLEPPILPETLRNIGYVTGGFSANLYWITHAYGFDRGFVHYEDYNRTFFDFILGPFYGRLFERFFMQPLGSNGQLKRRSAEMINSSVLRWMADHRTSPYFVFINYIDAHDPYLPPEPYRSKFSVLESPGGLLDCELGKCGRDLSQDERQAEIDAYDGAIAYIDDQVKELFEGVKNLGELDNTIVIIVSDHGEGFNEHGMYLHAHSLYSEAIRVPLLFWWKDHLPEGRRITTPVSIISIPSTLISILPGENENAFPAASLSDLWINSEASRLSDPVLSNMGPDSNVNPNLIDNGWIMSIVDGSMHYLEYENQPAELYDWDTDLPESRNLGVLTKYGIQLSHFAAVLNDLFKLHQPSSSPFESTTN